MGLTVCKRRSLPWPHPPLRSRSLPHLRGNTPSGSVDPSWLPSPPSSRCGSASRNTTSPAHPLSTGNASKLLARRHRHQNLTSALCFHGKTLADRNDLMVLLVFLMHMMMYLTLKAIDNWLIFFKCSGPSKFQTVLCKDLVYTIVCV